MNANVKLWCFLLLLPFFLAVGHDLYANYIAHDSNKMRLESFQIDPKSYQGSDLGYIFVKYIPNQFQFARAQVGEDNWSKWVDPVLRLYTFVIALVPALLFFTWLLLSRIFDRGPFSGSGPSRRSSQSTNHREDKPMEFKYRRR